MASQAQINEEKWQKNGAEIMRIARKYNMKVLDLLQAFDELKALLRVFDEKQNELDCTHGDAVKWNPYNEVVQCHKCGQVFVSATELDAVRKEVNERWMNQKANDHDARIRADERREILELVKERIADNNFEELDVLHELRTAIEKRGEK